MSGVPEGKFHLYATTFVVAVVWMVLDQASKEWAVRTLEGQAPRDLGPLILRVIRNPGAAFSLPIEIPILFVAVAILVTVLVIRALPDTESPVLAAAYGLVVGGAFGNAIDRIFRSGEVVDMLDLDFPPLTNFPVFNVADIGITVGAALVAVLMILEDKRRADAAAVLEPLGDAGSSDTSAEPASDMPADPGADPTAETTDASADEADPAADRGDVMTADADADADSSDGPSDGGAPVLPPPAG